MFHLSGYTVAIGTVADTDIPAIVDDIMTIQNNHFVLSQEHMLICAAAMSATISRAKLASPSMRQIASPYIRPVIAAAIPPANPNLWVLTQSPFRIPPFEEIQMQGTSGVAMTERFTGLIWLSDGYVPAPPGNIIPWRWTGTTAAVANTWTTVTATFADTIPTGLYSIVGSEHFSTNGQAHRWIIPNQLKRPGTVSMAANSSRQPYATNLQQFGLWGTFRSNDLPRPQVLCNGTDNSHEGYLYIQRIGNIAA